MEYQAEDDLAHESVPLNRDEKDQSAASSVYGSSHTGMGRAGIFSALFFISLVLNLVLAAFLFHRDATISEGKSPVTSYATLSRDVPMAFNSSSMFGTGNQNETDRSIRWESLDTSAGEISLDNEWAKARGLPDSTPFFWNNERSIYLLNAYHSLHCLRKVRRWVTISHHNGTQLDGYLHLVHCMDHLLQNIVCEADDTPMYTSPKHNATTGLGQQRMCRSWDKLAKWANEQTACFGYINETQGVDAVIQRFRYCPQGSTLLQPMRRYFGYQNDWFERRPADIDTMPPYWEDSLDGK